MRRRIIKLCVFLLLGAIVNVAVAVGCSLGIQWLPGFVPRQCLNDADRAFIWLKYAQDGWPGCPKCNAVDHEGDCLITQFAMYLTRLGATEITLQVSRITQAPSIVDGRRGEPLRPVANDTWRVLEVRAGWPLACLQGGSWSSESGTIANSFMPANSNGGEISAAQIVVGTFPPSPWTPAGIPDTRLVPLGSIWPGFAINTIFYAAILGVLFFAPGVVRRTIRRRRGLCPACAYPVGESAVCTECGAAVNTKGPNL